jgi:hypothetical protein
MLALAFSRTRFADKLLYLVKAGAFAPWLLRGASGGGDEATAASSAAGDDIYPLF